MIRFYKSGRPTKKEKGLLREINSYLEQLPQEKSSSYSFVKERVDSYERLEEIWESLSSESVSLTEDYSSFDDSVQEDNVELAEEITQQETEVIEEKPNNFESSSSEINETDLGDSNKVLIEEQEDLVDEETGEIFNNTENKSVKMEDAKILQELDKEAVSEEIPKSFSPLEAQLKERSYTQGGDEIDIDIPEPTFDNAPKAEDIIKEAEQESKDAQKESVKEQEEQREKPLDNVTNESMSDLSDKEKDEATEHLVETVLDTYDTLHVVGRQAFKISDVKLDKKARKEGIDSGIMIPIDEEGNEASLKDVVEDVNNQIEEVLTPDPEFREKVKPPLKRVFAKKGWGMTDEQRVMGLFAQDIGTKAVQLFAVQKQLNTMIQNIGLMHREQIKAARQSAPTPPPVTPDSIVTPPQSPSPAPEPIYEDSEPIYSDEDLTSSPIEMTENENSYSEEVDIPATFE
jgi:hypothetical protein